jgi:hypothetical protein
MPKIRRPRRRPICPLRPPREQRPGPLALQLGAATLLLAAAPALESAARQLATLVAGG